MSTSDNVIPLNVQPQSPTQKLAAYLVAQGFTRMEGSTATSKLTAANPAQSRCTRTSSRSALKSTSKTRWSPSAR